MDLIIRSAKIIDPKSTHHLKTLDVGIKNGKIQQLAPSISTKTKKELQFKGLHLSKGWIDLSVNYQDPGFEQKENLESGLRASAAGGFTKVCVSPETFPPRDSKSQVEYLINQAQGNIVDAYPYGTVSKKLKGNELAELLDMHQSGAIAFTEGKQSIENPNLLYRALMYAKAFGGLIINFPNTAALNYKGVMNEGKTSTTLGLKGIAEISESIMVNRDLYLLDYTQSRLHFATISSPESLRMIKSAKKDGKRVSCDLASYHLLLHDENLESFDSNYKTLPPLRSRESVNHLIKHVKEGVVDALCSDHFPQDIESKKKEFDRAAFGMINAQTAFSVANTALSDHLSLEKIIYLFTEGPANILNLELGKIEVGEKANLTLFAPEEAFILSKESSFSKAENTPLFGKKLKGKVIGVVNNRQVFES